MKNRGLATNPTIRLPILISVCLLHAWCSTTEEPLSNALYTFDLQQIAQENPEYTRFYEDSPFGRSALLCRAEPGATPFSLPRPKEGVPWTEANYLVADVWHTNQHSNIIRFNFFSKHNQDEPRISSKMGILPELKTRLVLPLAYLDGQTFFMARQERRLKGTMPGNRLPLELITRITCSLEPVAEGFSPEMWIANLRLTKYMPAPLPDEKPVVDEFGQWKVRDWPGKTKSLNQLVEQLTHSHEQAQTAAFPDEWSPYGGWKAKRFMATGFFRTQYDGKRWWLVDPGGYAFFSIGLDVVTPKSSGPFEGMQDLHEWMPPKEKKFVRSYSSSRGRAEFSYLTANLIRVFGGQWETRWQEMTKGFMKRWRFNTIGNWSNPDFIQSARMPYLLPLRGFPNTRVLLYRDFPDVFSPEYAEASAEYAKQMAAYRDDPYLIGYFLRNEPLWAFGDNIIASEMLSTDTPSFTRRELIKWLKERYHSDVSALSAAWNHTFDSLEALEITSVLNAAALSDQAEADLREFSGRMVDEYIRRPSEAVRKAAPNHLNLGIRYARISSELCYRGANYFDVFSINSYTAKPNQDAIAEITKRTGKPVMIGEFHHGAIDRGLPSTGIYGVASQKDRGIAYRYYVEQGARIHTLVGIHYFQLNDQPILGRFDGENYNIGLVDICNVPYKGLTEAVRRTNGRIYEVAAGRVEAFSTRAKAIPRIFF